MYLDVGLVHYRVKGDSQNEIKMDSIVFLWKDVNEEVNTTLLKTKSLYK